MKCQKYLPSGQITGIANILPRIREVGDVPGSSSQALSAGPAKPRVLRLGPKAEKEGNANNKVKYLKVESDHFSGLFGTCLLIFG